MCNNNNKCAQTLWRMWSGVVELKNGSSFWRKFDPYVNSWEVIIRFISIFRLSLSCRCDFLLHHCYQHHDLVAKPTDSNSVLTLTLWCNNRTLQFSHLVVCWTDFFRSYRFKSISIQSFYPVKWLRLIVPIAGATNWGRGPQTIVYAEC